ncbi:MAG: ABC transporter ATP-binding protein [Pseudomonadota bacterium]
MSKHNELLVLNGLTKRYPGVVASDDVSFSIGPGEIHALLGENGAGKSTLVKMIYGLVAPDAGTMQFKGASHEPTAPSAARAAGVGMVFQHFSLFDALTVEENIAVGLDTKQPNLKQAIEEVSQTYGLPLDPRAQVGDLSAGERQRVEIVRCLLQSPKLLIMDEPTSVLTPQEVEVLFHTLRQLAADGTSILYISHKLDEIRALCDHATVLRHGKVVGTCVPRDTTTGAMAEMMVGVAVTPAKRLPAKPGGSYLRLTNVSVPSLGAFGTPLRGITLDARSNEVLGIAGVAGNGQDELFSVISGEITVRPDHVTLEGEPVGHLGPRQRRMRGLGAAPEERLGHAAAPQMKLTENALLTAMVRLRLAPGGWINWAATEAYANSIIERFDVRTPGPNTAAGALSGGNLQKFVVGREVMQSPQVLVVNQPTWGVDAAAAARIRKELVLLASQGAAVVVISQDLDELLEISDRIGAMCEGRLVEPHPTGDLTMEGLGLMLGGSPPVAKPKAPKTEAIHDPA